MTALQNVLTAMEITGVDIKIKKEKGVRIVRKGRINRNAG